MNRNRSVASSSATSPHVFTQGRVNHHAVGPIECVAIADLKPYARHARQHGRRQLELLRRNMQTFGFLVPILIDHTNTIVAGHARVKAAADLGMRHVPALRVTHLSEAELRAFRVADNKLVELGTWDEAALKLEFQDLIDLDFDLELTAFEVPEIDRIVLDLGDPAAEVFQPVSGPPVSQAGDLWLLGPHRLLCGDALQPASYARLLEGKAAAMCFTDPPYNVPIHGHVGGRGSIRHREFAQASGEMSPEAYATFLADMLLRLYEVLADGALVYICIDHRSAGLLDRLGRELFQMLNWIVWAKDVPGQGSMYRSQHELILLLRKSDRHRNNIQLGKYGRNRSNLWKYPGVTGFGGRRDELRLHPTTKPVAMVADAILDCTAPNELVLDCFIGAGATLIACERTGRQARGIELDPLYVDTIVRRWQQETGRAATCALTGLPFEEVGRARRGDQAPTLPSLSSPPARRALPPPNFSTRDGEEDAS